MNLAQKDPDIAKAVNSELLRQRSQIELIASENIVSTAVMEAQGSVLTNKYAEGYPNRRYYGGCEHVDIAESLAIERVCKLFDCEFANVQPHSGAQANTAVMLALLQPGDTFMGLSLDSGGHLTHGCKVTLSGKWFNPIPYDVSPNTYTIDYDQVEKLALENKPKLIIAGGSAYPRTIDFKRFRAIADKVGAYLMVDMAHFAGLVAAGEFPSPLPYADVVTSTTHKTLRGPRGGIILSKNVNLGKKLNSAVFPGLQGGPLMHVIAAKAVAFHEALQPEFKVYIKQVIANAKALSNRLMEQGISVTSDGTDSHLLLLDLRRHNITGKALSDTMEEADLTCNKNSIPFDSASPSVTSGIRVGTPACTTRGFKEKEFIQVADWIIEIVESLKTGTTPTVIPRIKQEVAKILENFPIY